MNVFPVDRGEKCLIQPPHDLVGQEVALVFEFMDRFYPCLDGVELLEQLHKAVRRLDEIFRGFVEEFKEIYGLGDELHIQWKG